MAHEQTFSDVGQWMLGMIATEQSYRRVASLLERWRIQLLAPSHNVTRILWLPSHVSLSVCEVYEYTVAVPLTRLGFYLVADEANKHGALIHNHSATSSESAHHIHATPACNKGHRDSVSLELLYRWCTLRATHLRVASRFSTVGGLVPRPMTITGGSTPVFKTHLAHSQ